MSAGGFKARCLALLDRVARTGRTVVVTKRGRPVARVAPLDQAAPADLRGSIVHQEDIVAPVDPAPEHEHGDRAPGPVDPPDRIIVATAMHFGAILVTRDQRLRRRRDLRTCW